MIDYLALRPTRVYFSYAFPDERCPYCQDGTIEEYEADESDTLVIHDRAENWKPVLN
jgi:hypothetical protein